MDHPKRRLSDKIIAAHEQAIREKKSEVAELLIQALQVEASYIGGKHPERRGAIEDMEQAFTRHFAFMNGEEPA